jgi:hypothetical protein
MTERRELLQIMGLDDVIGIYKAASALVAPHGGGARSDSPQRQLITAGRNRR